MRRFVVGLGALLGTTAVIAACSVGSDCDFGLCAGTPVGSDSGPDGDSGGPDVVGPPMGCDVTADLMNAPLCVDDTFGVFVSPTGKANAAGTKEAPVDSVTSALKIIKNKPRIYLCEGTYADKIELSVPVSLYGGLACDTWAWNGHLAVIKAPPAGQIGLRVAGVTSMSPVVISDLSFSASPGDPTNLSSIAAFISDSQPVTLRRVTLSAGTGMQGGDGVAGVTGTPTPADLTGNNPDAVNGGAAQTCTCSSGGSTTGGRGGDTNGLKNDGDDGLQPMTPSTSSGKGQTSILCQMGGVPAQRGSDAPPAMPASTPAKPDITPEGWTPANGDPGAAGLPGQGGGGAGGNPGGASPGGGGSGGCGGCGGTGGGGGTSGGSSIALVALRSTVVLSSSTLTAMTAGNGGAGKAGGTPMGGGAGGGRIGSCSGAQGGTGGMGGAGAGGSGGVSAGIAYKTSMVTADLPTTQKISLGDAGAAGTGGKPGTNDGQPGMKQAILGL